MRIVKIRIVLYTAVQPIAMPKQVVRTLVARVCCAAALQVKQTVKQPRGVDGGKEKKKV